MTGLPRAAATPPSSSMVARRLGALQRARARRRQRGAMILEGLAVMLTTTLLLACVVHFHSVHSTAGRALAASRLEGWQRAYAGCKLEAADEVRQMIGQGTSRAPGIGAFPAAIRYDVQTPISCNEPPAGDEPSLAHVLNSLRQFVDLQPVEMLTWLFGASELFPGMSAALSFVGNAVNSFSNTISNAHGALASLSADVLTWVQEAAAGALEWLANLF